jgi:hypothetical protein
MNYFELHEGKQEGPARGMGSSDVRPATSLMSARGATLPWARPSIDEIATTHGQARRMVRAASDVMITVFNQGRWAANFRIPKQEVLRNLRRAEREMQPPLRMSLTVGGYLPDVLWIHT